MAAPTLPEAAPPRPRPRPDGRFPPILPVSEAELARPTLGTLLKLIYTTLARLLHEPLGILMASAFVLVLLWGHHGRVELLGLVWPGWEGLGSDPATRASIIPGLAWDQELLSFAIGALLLVGIPVLIVLLVFRQPLRAYGLGRWLPGRGRLTLLSAALLAGVSLPAFLLSTGDADMRATYPFFRGEFDGGVDFALYELGYLLFFLAIEFMFRGYLLLGLFNVRGEARPPGARGALVFGTYAIFISMLAYTVWHLGKPLPELYGTLVWGAVAGAVVLLTGTIWHVVAVHWLLNVVLDLILWQGW